MNLMNKDTEWEEVLREELDRLRQDYIRAYNNSKSVDQIVQNMANIVIALATVYLARNGGGYVQ